MPSLQKYKQMLGSNTNGQACKIDADGIVENTWYDDLASRTAYIYDWYNDDYKNVLNNLEPQNDVKKIPIDIKFIVNNAQSFESNAITYHIQLKPSQECNVNYYFDFFEKRYDAQFPVGLFCDIQDSKGKYNKWLIVGCANSNDPQFPTYEILRCNYVLNILVNNIKYNISSVIRMQNSYNSGIGDGSMIETVDDKQKFIVPLNRDFEYIYYNQRVIIDNKVLTEPKCWRVSKIDRVTYNGICIATLVQDKFDSHKDYVEVDVDGNVVAMWADYFESKITPTEPTEDIPIIRSEITYSGVKPELKIDGSYKKLTVKFYDGEKETEFRYGVWKFTIDDEDASTLLDIVTKDLEENQIKIKFVGNNEYIGKKLKITYESDVVSYIEMEIKSL